MISSCDSEHWPQTLIFELDLDSVKLNHHAKYLGQRSFSSKVIVRTYRHTYTPEQSLDLDHKSGL